MKKYYTSVSKGGVYELLGASSGAGSSKGMPLVVYQDVANGRIYHRQPEDFSVRMKLIPESALPSTTKDNQMLEFFTNDNPLRTDDFALPVDGPRRAAEPPEPAPEFVVGYRYLTRAGASVMVEVRVGDEVCGSDGLWRDRYSGRLTPPRGDGSAHQLDLTHKKRD